MTCCDGTGWTGVQGVICAEHYEACDTLALLHGDVEEDPYGWGDISHYYYDE